MTINIKEIMASKIFKISAISVLSLAVVGGVVSGAYYYHQKKVAAEKSAKFQQRVLEEMAGVHSKRPSDYEAGIDYNKAIKTNKAVLVLFYADWCRYCMRFMPIFQAMSDKYSDQIVFSKVNVEDSKYRKLVKETGISGYPTVYIIDPKYDNKVLIPNSELMQEETLEKEIKRFVRIRRLLDKK